MPRIPLPLVRKPNLHSDRGQDSNPCAWRSLGPQNFARMVPLYHDEGEGDKIIKSCCFIASPPARKPLPRVRKPNMNSDRGQDSNPCAWRPLGHQSTHGFTVPMQFPQSVTFIRVWCL
ncbi:hypothetical protein E2C01_021102 [Portunus trituberculatus]|uniref:Uncharacterized protein n=1 Tax=Portunus trituberculatus TaxID=210409 RepID=A0A5B7E3R9_PORTR|nr:hypothetical protein [Portunus trituberculatus]